MGRKKTLIAWIICGLLCLTACFPAWANNSSGGGTVPKSGGTDIVAGVVVDYMGKLRFVVLDRDTNNPISGASVEIYIPSLQRYVLFGLTDSNGVFELDVAFNMSNWGHERDQFNGDDPQYPFTGTILYLNDNNIQYRVYKSGWLPYPYMGTYLLEGKTIPETVTIYLYKNNEVLDPDEPGPGPGPVPGPGPGPGTDNDYFEQGGTTFVDKLLSILEEALPLGGLGGTGTSGIPKTGVEGAIHYWAFGLVFFVIAAMAIWKMLKSDDVSREVKRSK